MSPASLPVAVDLDGTLARVDTLEELIVRLILRKPLRFLGALPSLLRSRAKFKTRLAILDDGENAQVPWNDEVIASLHAEDSQDVVLCTASNRDYAAKLVAPLHLFTAVYGSDNVTNLKAETKGAFLRDKYGSRGFCYYGNAFVDLKVWEQAGKAVVVSDDPHLVTRAKAVCPLVEQIAPRRPPLGLSVARALRAHQWAKNLLLFVPLLASHRFREMPLVHLSALAFAIFCLLSSAVYLLNDATDLDADRCHRTKAKRPFASGALSVLYAIPGFLLFSLSGLALGYSINRTFALICTAYLVLAVMYSTFLKKFALLDVYALAALYTLRIVSGAAATGIVLSVWLSGFSIFIFLSLALVKRYTEILQLSPTPGTKIARRGYYSTDAPFVLAQGLIFLGCATLVLAVYLSSSAVTLLYKTPALLWLAVAVISFWGGRLWLLASRQLMHEDPVLFALTDRVSWACFFALVLVFFGAMTLA